MYDPRSTAKFAADAAIGAGMHVYQPNSESERKIT